MQNLMKAYLQLDVNELPIHEPYDGYVESKSHVHATLSHPVRMAMPQVVSLLKSVTGCVYDCVSWWLERAPLLTASQLYRSVMQHPQVQIWCEKHKHLHRQTIETFIYTLRYQVLAYPHFQLSQPLLQSFDDLSLKGEVPVEFLGLPAPGIYLELITPQHRHASNPQIEMSGHSFVIEGVYLNEYSFQSVPLDLLSDKAIESLSLLPSRPLRIIECCFSASPITLKSGDPLIFDQASYFSLYIQDETELVSDIVLRHRAYFERRDRFDEQEWEAMETHFETVLKSLLYINIKDHQRAVMNDKKALSTRLSRASSRVQKRSISKKRDVAFDHIRVGSTQPYVSLSTLTHKIRDKTGLVPHFRRSYYAPRWTGVGRTERQIVRIKATIINASDLGEAAVAFKRYLV
ncbi:hypothetical protein AB6D11_06350 [Vibrio splendidus]